MMDILILLLINALAIVGIYLSFGQGMVFRSLGLWIEKRVSYNLTMPFFNCPTCMASVHSIIPFWYNNELNMDSLITYIIYVPALAALSTWMANKIVEE